MPRPTRRRFIAAFSGFGVGSAIGSGCGIERVLGLGLGLGAASKGVVAATPEHATPRIEAVDIVLPNVYGPRIDPAQCLVSEKYDGVRAAWDGKTLRHRSGRPVSAPAWFVDALPAQPLDGELWLGRGRFDELSGIVRKVSPVDAEWRRVQYMVFEAPGMAGPFIERAEGIRACIATSASTVSARAGSPWLRAAPQDRVAGHDALQRRLDETVAGGGEGLMLHLASAPYIGGRTDALTKLKPFLDAEAVVIGPREGRGKYSGQVGSLQVRTPDGRVFFVGSGLDDAMRRTPPAAGTPITYRYRDLTPSGLPRFATFLRVHEAM